MRMRPLFQNIGTSPCSISLDIQATFSLQSPKLSFEAPFGHRPFYEGRLGRTCNLKVKPMVAVQPWVPRGSLAKQFRAQNIFIDGIVKSILSSAERNKKSTLSYTQGPRHFFSKKVFLLYILELSSQ